MNVNISFQNKRDSYRRVIMIKISYLHDYVRNYIFMGNVYYITINRIKINIFILDNL